MHQIIIVGNSFAGLETYEVLMDTLAEKRSPQLMFKGFLSHMGYEGNLRSLQPFLLGSDETYEACSEDRFVIAIADPGIRRSAYQMLKNKGASFCNIISKRAYVSPYAVLGEANIIGMGCTITGGVRIGAANYFNGACKIGHDVMLGDFNFLGPGASVLGGSTIGSENRFGTNCVVMEKCVVGDRNIIAPGSVVYKGCESNVRMAGNPAFLI